MAKVLIATVKPFSAEAVTELRKVLEEVNHEVLLLEKYGDQSDKFKMTKLILKFMMDKSKDSATLEKFISIKKLHWVWTYKTASDRWEFF